VVLWRVACSATTTKSSFLLKMTLCYPGKWTTNRVIGNHSIDFLNESKESTFSVALKYRASMYYWTLFGGLVITVATCSGPL
jgi:hypothetical protein